MFVYYEELQQLMKEYPDLYEEHQAISQINLDIMNRLVEGESEESPEIMQMNIEFKDRFEAWHFALKLVGIPTMAEKKY
jgi:hypothetical protein